MAVEPSGLSRQSLRKPAPTESGAAQCCICAKENLAVQFKVQILLVTGPAGVGKSTVCWEMGAQLAAAQVAHAVIETDELDRVFPRPSTQDLEKLSPGTLDISSINLAAIWSTYRALGHSRLIMSGVMLHTEYDRRWISAAVPNAQITIVRLRAAETTLLARLDQREVGSDREGQMQRTLRQARRMAAERTDGLLLIPTDGMTPQALAARILREAGWLPASQMTPATKID